MSKGKHHCFGCGAEVDLDSPSEKYLYYSSGLCRECRNKAIEESYEYAGEKQLRRIADALEVLAERMKV